MRLTDSGLYSMIVDLSNRCGQQKEQKPDSVRAAERVNMRLMFN